MENVSEQNDENSSQGAEEPAGGRVRGDEECPPPSTIFFAAMSHDPQELTDELREHLGVCAACQHNFEQAAKSFAAGETSNIVPEQPTLEVNPEPDLDLSMKLSMALRVPVIGRYSAGCLRCMPGKSALLVILDPKSTDLSWGQTCFVQCGGRRLALQPGVLSPDLLFPWGPAEQSFKLLIGTNEDEFDEMDFDWEGWGEEIRFIAFAHCRNNEEQAETISRDFEELIEEFGGEIPAFADRDWFPCPEPVPEGTVVIYGLDGVGDIGDRAFEKLWDCLEPALKRTLASWKGVAPVNSQDIELALTETSVMAYRSRTSLSSDPAKLLLKMAATNLLRILEERVGARCPKGDEVDRHIIIARFLAESEKKQWSDKIVVSPSNRLGRGTA